ncbi:alpha-L-arabinofuranosidase [Nostocales cyanobacterium HT-58-2]|nr:alpha-L-arabinofuranosidase [Nostocales cyanobacterium HT-58-2]
MQRRDIIKLAITSAGMVGLLDMETWAAKKYTAAKVTVDWDKSQGQTTSFTFGSNDYEITFPERAADSIYQKRLANLGIPLIRIHHGGLCDSWTSTGTKSWNQTKIKAGYEVSFPQRPTIIQNIPGWPKWMAQKDGRLDLFEYDRYAAFCAELVNIITRRLALKQVIYWEPFNEKETHYEKVGKLDELWTIYNKAAKAMKAANPQIKVGGPALNWNDTSKLASFLQACRANVDFISWHSYATGNARESTENLMSRTSGYASQVKDFRRVAKQYIPDRKVPLLLGEYNINYSWDSGENRQNTHIGAVWFASVLKHLADAGIDMATSWHLKDGIYGMIDPQDNLRPAASVFAWGIKYLTGWLMYAESDHPLIEAMAVRQADKKRSLLLINKSGQIAQLRIVNQPSITGRVPIFYLNERGIKQDTLATAGLQKQPLVLPAYSLALLRIS